MAIRQAEFQVYTSQSRMPQKFYIGRELLSVFEAGLCPKIDKNTAHAGTDDTVACICHTRLTRRFTAIRP